MSTPPPRNKHVIISDDQDALRFSTDVKEKAQRPIGAYAADIPPGPGDRSATGTLRGEELFHRPDLERGWRTTTRQRHAETVAGKEVEIEFLTRRNAEYRQQTAAAERETQRAQHRLLMESTTASENQEAMRHAAERAVVTAHDQMERMKDQCESKIRQLSHAHETELRNYEIRQREQREAAAHAALTLQKALLDVRDSSANEVKLSMQLADARVAELQAALTACNDALHQTHERHSQILIDLRTEMQKSEERGRAQVQEAEQRAEQLRIRMTADVEVANSQRDDALTALQLSQEKERVVRSDLNNWENRFREWVARVLGDVERINEAFVSSIRDMEDAEHINIEGATLLDRPISTDRELRELLLPPALTQSVYNIDSLLKRTIEQVAVLTKIRDRHNNASNKIIERLREALLHVATVEQRTERRQHDGALQLAQFGGDLREVRARQERIESAVDEVRRLCAESTNAANAAAARVRFIADDLKSRSELDLAAAAMPNISGVAAPEPKESGEIGDCRTLTFVLAHVEGTSALWQKIPAVMQIASPLVNSVLRSYATLHGGTVAISEGDAFLLVFACPVAASRFAIDVQLALEKAPWPSGLREAVEAVAPPASPELHMKGLRVSMCLHSGPAELVELRSPWGVTFGAAASGGHSRYCYTGKAIAQLFQLGSLVHGGQVVATAYTWSFVAHRSSELGTLCDVRDLGTFKVGDMGGENAADGELCSLLSFMPLELAAFRKFLSPTETEGFRDARRGTGMSQEVLPLFRWNSEAAMRALTEKSIQNADAARILREEFVGLNQNIAAIHVRVKEAEAAAKRYTQADAVAHVTAMDKLAIRADIFGSDVERLTRAQKRLAGQIGISEEKIAAVNRSLLSEEEFKRRLQTLTSRCSEVINEATTKADRRVTEYQCKLQQATAIQEDLRKQLTKYLVQHKPTFSDFSGSGIGGVAASSTYLHHQEQSNINNNNLFDQQPQQQDSQALSSAALGNHKNSMNSRPRSSSVGARSNNATAANNNNRKNSVSGGVSVRSNSIAGGSRIPGVSGASQKRKNSISPTSYSSVTKSSVFSSSGIRKPVAPGRKLSGSIDMARK